MSFLLSVLTFALKSLFFYFQPHIWAYVGIRMSEKMSPFQLIQKFPLDNQLLNQQLVDYVEKEMERTKGQKKEQHSNIGGWQSARDLHAQLAKDPSGGLLRELFQSFSAPIMQYIHSCHAIFDVPPASQYDWSYTGAWFNVAVRGGYNAPHTHPLSQLSAAYYIRTEDPPPDYPFSGRIDFIHENISYPFFPKAGELILFPGSMLHFVHPYYGNTLRICLSFNATNICQVLE